MPSTKKRQAGAHVNYKTSTGRWRPAQIVSGSSSLVLRMKVITGGTYPNYTYGTASINGGVAVAEQANGSAYVSGTYPNYVYNHAGKNATNVYTRYRGS